LFSFPCFPFLVFLDLLPHHRSKHLQLAGVSKGIPYGPADVHERRTNCALRRRNGRHITRGIGRHIIRGIGRNGMSAKKLQQVRGADSRCNAFNHHQSDAAIASDQNNCRDGNPAFFFGVEKSPRTHHFLLRVAQNWKP